ncbi:hypothetical protein GDO86_018299 [Hymenochirus boettgeri]|uniref:Uncharacterized protein n=1 Tax=Hymenochirus boettgeri TaxID=247094 RepID=A0A8T2IGJ8_9PIPI|nr:hypothetical protein GDO86_018299 [Hymenochirus boettgeri]
MDTSNVKLGALRTSPALPLTTLEAPSLDRHSPEKTKRNPNPQYGPIRTYFYSSI